VGKCSAVTKYITDEFQTSWYSLGKNVKLGTVALLARLLM